MPITVNASEPNKCKPAVSKAKEYRPWFNMPTTSAEKLEKVVSAPKKPVTKAKRQTGSRSGMA